MLVAATADVYEPDNDPSHAKFIYDGNSQPHSIYPVGDQDWVKFTLTQPASIILLTNGLYPTTDDTLMGLYNSSLQQIDFNDDRNPNVLYSYIQRCGATALQAGTYYAKVVKRLNDATIASYGIAFKINPAGPSSCIPNTEVRITGRSRGSYWVHPETSLRPAYALNTGPVRVRTLDNVKPLIASMGVYLRKAAGYESYSEFVGMPSSRLKDTYYFPWYSNNTSVSGLATQLCFANVGTAAANITVTIGSLTAGVYNGLPVNQAKCVSYTNLNAGPVKVKSSSTVGSVPVVPIVASLNTRMKNNASFTSYTEFGGLSASDTYSTDYMFPVYNNLTGGGVASQLRFTNIGSSQTTVAITVNGVRRPTTYTLASKQSWVGPLPNVNSGPVHVQSLSAVPISASMIVKLSSAVNYASYTEFMGLPQQALTQTRFVFPWYNNSTSGGLVSQLRIVNLGSGGTIVSVTIAGKTIATVSLSPGQVKTVSYPNVNGGPLVLQSSSGVPIMASMMTYLKKGTGYTSYSEFIGQPGLPDNQLLPSAWFPWYNNDSNGNFLSQLRFALPANP